ncbi:pyridoxal phosphate-dependent aminotransferase [Candidatus Micrarchaeota archaeon]|nr:pyridoxal phosphate-dependent aminotransferase [Candidatus Micrarchaeota archaeon]
MNSWLSARMDDLKPSATLALNARVRKLRADGRKIIDLGIGEPDFDTPAAVKEAGKRAIDENKSHYTPSAGTLELRKAICAKFSRENNLDYAIDAVMASNGAKQVLYNLFMATLSAGDEVIVLLPYWFTYADQIKLAGGKPVFVQSKEDFQPDLNKIRAAVTGRTRMIVLNSPSNPCGVVYSREALIEIGELAVEKNFLIASDEVYEKIVYPPAVHHSIAALDKRFFDRTITINALSKSHAMTGWRLGYVGGPREVIKAMDDIQGQTTSNPSSITQGAAVEALANEQPEIPLMVKEFAQRRELVCAALEKMGVKVVKPSGAFYVFADFSPFFNGVSDSVGFCEFLLEKAGVALVPGNPFGMPNYARVSFASSRQNLAQAMDAVAAAVR